MAASEPVPNQPACRVRALTVPCAIASLTTVRDFIAGSALSLDIPEHDAYHFQLAADEACTNIIQHGSTASPAAECGIVLELCSRDEGWTLEIRDHGRPFDPTRLPPPDLKSGLRGRKPGGLGVYLIRSLMDSVHYRTTAGENVLTMTRRRA